MCTWKMQYPITLFWGITIHTSIFKALSPGVGKPVLTMTYTFTHSSVSKESVCNAGDLGLIPALGRSPGEEKGYPLQYSGLENSMDYAVHGIAKSQTRLSDFVFTSLCTFPSNVTPEPLLQPDSLTCCKCTWGKSVTHQDVSSFKQPLDKSGKIYPFECRVPKNTKER